MTHYGNSPLLNLQQKYGNWYHKILKKQTPYLVLKIRSRNGYLKIASVFFVRRIKPELDLFNFLLNPLMYGRSGGHANLRRYAVFCCRFA